MLRSNLDECDEFYTMENVMNNRDFFTKPNQANGRSAEDYGHTYTSNNNVGTTGGFWGLIIGAVVFAIGMYAFIAA